MECVFCGGKTRVIATRKRKGRRHSRRRQCIECHERFTTYEVNQAYLLDLLEEHLPVRLVDEISNKLAIGFPEHEKNSLEE